MKKLATLMDEMNDLLENELYSLTKRKDTQEYHIFLNKKKGETCQFVEKQSICTRMEASQSDGHRFVCRDEKYTRAECAKLGREVCGTCVSHLYADFKKKDNGKQGPK